jgi:hypothetical protein
MEHHSRAIAPKGRVRSRRSLVGAVLAMAALGFSLAAAGAAADTSEGTLALSATFTGTFKQVDCPPSASALPGMTDCYSEQGSAGHAAPPPLLTVSGAPGLGRTALTGTAFRNLPYGDLDSCRLWSVPDGKLQVAGKGEIDFSAKTESCQAGSSSLTVVFSLPFTVTGGSGTYAGATGSGAMNLTLKYDTFFQKSTFTGMLTVPGLAFDTIPPVIKSSGNKLILVKKRARGARVRYTVGATDSADGSVPVTCTPRSGSLFRLGRTRVRCASTDSSANTAGTSFTITVRSR